MERKNKIASAEITGKKFVVEYDIPFKLAVAADYKAAREREILPEILECFLRSDFRIVDAYIVHGTLAENDYYGKDEPKHSTVVIIESEIMHTIYPDFSDYIDQILEESMRFLQDESLCVECYWKIKEMDIDVFVLSLKKA